MADFDHNPRGGLTTNRESLHASDGYKRQVAALDRLFKESEMDEKMKPAQAVAIAIHEGLRRNGAVVMYNEMFEKVVADAINTHLTQPAQAVNERMTLEQVRIVLAGHVADDDRMTMATQRLLLQAIDAHIAQPAQAVDARCDCDACGGHVAYDFMDSCWKCGGSGKLTRAIGNTKAVMWAEQAEALLREAECELRGSCLSRESARISQDIRTHLSEPRT